LGIIQGPRHGLEHLLASGEIREILPGFTPPPLPVSVLLPSARHVAPRVRSFVDWMAERVSASLA
jgi:DNA-binding transcriptional LysR family regulator